MLLSLDLNKRSISFQTTLNIDSTQAPQCECIVKTHQVHRIQHIRSCKRVRVGIICSLPHAVCVQAQLELYEFHFLRLRRVVFQTGALRRRAGFWGQIVTLEPVRLRKSMLQLIKFCRKRDPELQV